jgi:predicted SPOUT superfamily RNA methylase MTH1
MHAEDPPHWRFQVTVSDLPSGQLVKQRGFDLTVATSPLGTPFANVKEAKLTCWKNACKVLLAFGAPARGLYKIAKLENEKINL